MIQGFETRELTDQVIRPFVKSAKGILHIKSKTVKTIFYKSESIKYVTKANRNRQEKELS